MNRSLKAGSLIKRRNNGLQIPPTIFKCIGLQEALGLRMNKIEIGQGGESTLEEGKS